MLDLGVIWRNLPFLMIQGFLGFGNFAGGTLRLAIPAIILGFILGIFIGIGRLAPQRWIRVPATLYVEFFRGVPLVMVIFWIWIVVPIVLNRSIPEYSVALAAFVIFEAAYLGEIVRAGIQSVPRGQVEAARSLGLGRRDELRHVVLPLALRLMVPPLTSQYLNLVKNSSLAVAIGYPDLVSIANTTMNQTGQAIEGIAIIMAVYLTVSLAISAFMNWYNKHIALVER